MNTDITKQGLDWSDPVPIIKQGTTLVAFLIAIAITAFATGLGFPHVQLLAAAVSTLVIATVLAVTLSTRRKYWRHEGLVWMLDFAALFMFELATDAHFTPLPFLAILLVLPFAGVKGIQNIAYAAAGTALVLVVPSIVKGGSLLEILIGAFATLALCNAGVIFYQVTDTQRKSLKKLKQSEIERERSAGMLRGFWEAVTEQSIIPTDLNGTIVAWNPGAEKLLGLPPEAVVYTHNIVDFHQRAELDARAKDEGIEAGPGAQFAALVEGARLGTPAQGNWTYVRSDGTTLPVQLTVTARLDESGVTGDIVGYLFVAVDMTEATAVAKLKNDFVGLISHELRTPLSSILGYLELLRDEDEQPLSASQLQYLSVAERNAHRLMRLVGDLLFTAQVESGAFQLEASSLDLVPLLQASLETARPIAATAGVTLASSFVSGLAVNGDPVRLGQAIDNLVSNAVKFTPRGGTVTISLDHTDAGAVVSVRDTGLGIPESEMDKLFSRFFRATTATNNAVPGVGLGLTITKAIVTAHHGEMAVESEVGVGTCFSMTLPLARVAVTV